MRVGLGDEAAEGRGEGDPGEGEGAAEGLTGGSTAPVEEDGLCDRNWRSAVSGEGAVVDVALPYPKAATAAMRAAATPKADATKGCAEIQRMGAPPVLSL